MKKIVAALAAAAVVVGAGFVSSAVSAPATAVAQEANESTEAPTTRLDTILDELVAEGVLTQDQADVVKERLANSGFARSHRHGLRGAQLTTVADLIGVDVDELREALVEGQTPAEVAADNGVDRQDLIDGLVAAAEERMNTAVSEGLITQEQADAKLAGIEDRIAAFVDGEVSFGERGRRGFGGRGFGDAEADAGSEAGFSA